MTVDETGVDKTEVDEICGEVIRLLLKYCIYCASAPSLHRESTDSLIIQQLDD